MRVVNTHAHTIDFLKGTLHGRGSTVKSHWLMAPHLTVFLCSRFLPDMACAGQYGMLRLKSKRYFLMLKSLSTNNPGHQYSKIWGLECSELCSVWPVPLASSSILGKLASL